MTNKKPTENKEKKKPILTIRDWYVAEIVDLVGFNLSSQRSSPMGVTAWKKHGEEFGYWKFFRSSILSELRDWAKDKNTYHIALDDLLAKLDKMDKINS